MTEGEAPQRLCLCRGGAPSPPSARRYQGLHPWGDPPFGAPTGTYLKDGEAPQGACPGGAQSPPGTLAGQCGTPFLENLRALWDVYVLSKVVV